MKVVFVMQYPGYVRYFDSTVRELSARGHEVEIYFELPNKQREGLTGLDESDPRVVVRDDFPGPPASMWKEFTQDVRRVTDFIRYLDHRFEHSDYLRDRVAQKLPSSFSSLARVRPLSPRLLDRLPAFVSLLEQATPRSTELDRFIADRRPDVVVITPLVTVGSRQNDVVKSARAEGVPTVLAVASWDHLTTKGLIRVKPDLALVWNDAQRKEATELHGYPDDHLEVTGAQPFDRWFDRKPSVSRDVFCAKTGLAAGKPYILFVGSTASISAPDAEQAFVARWAAALRTDPELAGHSILVRPHPYNSAGWSDADLSSIGDISVWPPEGANPADQSDQADYFDSLYFSSAVVGINTSAMIEAAIVGRPVLTVRVAEFADTQDGTLHFRYLLPQNGGFVRVANSLDEHRAQLREVLTDEEMTRQETQRFVHSFIRPLGVDRSATPLVVDAMERAAAGSWRLDERPRALRHPLHAVLWTIGMTQLLRDPWRLSGIVKRRAERLPEHAADLGEAVQNGAGTVADLLRALDNADGVGPGDRDALAPLADRVDELGANVKAHLASEEVGRELAAAGRVVSNRLRRAAKERGRAAAPAKPVADDPAVEVSSSASDDQTEPVTGVADESRDTKKEMMARFQSRLRGPDAGR